MNLVETHAKLKTTVRKRTREVTVLRRMRIFRRITRADAGRAIERSAKLIEKLENGRATLSLENTKVLLRRYRYTWQEYMAHLDDPDVLPELPSRSVFKSKAVPRTDGRKYKKQISKSSRVLKVLRTMRGWSQPMAASKCGWSRSCIDHLENGRVEITNEKIAQVLKAYDFKRHVFDELLEAPMLRDEVVRDSLNILTQLDNDKLKAVKALLDNFR